MQHMLQTAVEMNMLSFKPELERTIVTVGIRNAVAAQARISDGLVRLGLLMGISGPYSSLSSQGSVGTAHLASDDCRPKECKEYSIELLSADHRNKTYLALAWSISPTMYAAGRRTLLYVRGDQGNSD